MSEARAEPVSDLVSEPTLDPKLNSPLDSSPSPTLDSRLGLTPDPAPDPPPDLAIDPAPDPPLYSFADSDGAADVSDDAFDFPTDSDPIDSDSVDSDPVDSGSPHFGEQNYERGRSERAAARPLQKETRPWHRPRFWVLTACAVIACAMLVSIGVFAWDRWLRYDDASDIQGSWTAVGTQITIEIDENSIQITEDVAYEYSLNTSDKTITFTFGDMSGSGLYSFSEDRNTLVIDEQASADIVADFLAFYHLDTLFGLDGDDTSQSGDVDEAEDDEASDESDDADSSDESSLSLTLERLS